MDIRRWKLTRRNRFIAAGAAALVLAAAVGAALAGRDGGEGDPVDPVAQPPTDGRTAAVIRDYQAYWAAYLKAADPPDPASAGLAAHASGAELTRVRNALTARQRSGEVVRGAYQHQENLNDRVKRPA